MQEKTMVADTLAGINGELTRYAGMIAQSENKELKQTLKQFRTACEQSQEELYTMTIDDISHFSQRQRICFYF